MFCQTIVVFSRLISTLNHQGYLPIDYTGDWIYQCIEIV